MAFEILEHIDKLTPDGGTNDPRGDHSFHCPVCDAPNFKVNVRDGKWGTFSCDCANTDAGKRKIREALSPAIKSQTSRTKDTRPAQRRSWDYFTPITLERNQPALTVHRIDDGKGKRKIRQESHIPGHEPAEIKEKVLPYGLPEALQALKDGTPHVFWVEGEPCVDSLRALGFSAVTSIGGAGKFKPDRDGGHIPADRLVLVPDRDKPGLAHMEAIAESHPGCQWLFPFPGTAEWNGSMPATGGLDVADWIQLGATADHILKGIGPRVTSEHSDKTETPPEQQPPDIRDQFLRDAEGLKSRLDRGLAQIDAITNVASRSVALHTLRTDLNLSEKNFLALVKALSEAKAPQVAESFDDLMAADDQDAYALVEDLFPAGLVLIAAEGFAGKSSAAYQIAEAVTNGSKFAGQFQCQQSAALIVQMDESLTDAKKKWRRMGLQPAKGQLTIKWKFSKLMFPELRRWIEEKQAKLVVLDSLMTIAGGDISPKDAEFGLLIYRLNELAGELGITIICLHHVVKGNTKRTDITKEDIFGTAYVYNGASDAWGLWRTTEDGTGDEVFNLRCLKARSGLVDVGTTYQFTGDDEDRRMTFKGMADRSITLNEIHTAREKVIGYLIQGNGAAFTPQQLCQTLQLGSVKYAAKLCGELYDRRATTSIDRKKQHNGMGRPGYAYFHAEKNAYAKVEKVKVPSEELPSSPNSTTYPPTQEPSEREEREGVRETFSTDSLLRASDELSSDPEVFDW